MFERITFWMLLSGGPIALALYFNHHPILAFVLLLLITCLSLACQLVVRNRVVHFSKDIFQNRNSLLFVALTSAQEKIEKQSLAFQQIIRAIDKIGTPEQDACSVLDGEAGTAITNLQNKLSSVKEEERQRVWAAQGIAQISEIRKDNSSIQDYAFQIISYLVKFLEANQGVFYLQNDDENPCLELTATYAYGRRKYTNEKITLEPGAGLVGQCALEKGMILMTDVPKDYIKITSGLGEALPRCIILMPLIFRGEVFGVIEIASFKKFDQHKIEFINKACETIGLELSGIRSQERTRKLLEQSREEELRQNLEEMKAAQQEMLLKEDQLQKQLANTKRAMAMANAEQKKNEAILEGCMDAVITFSQNGTIEYFNQAAEEIFGMPRTKVISKQIDEILDLKIIEDQAGTLRIISFSGNEVNLRTEINAIDNRGEDISLLLTATKVKIDEKFLFTLFAQKVSVELF